MRITACAVTALLLASGPALSQTSAPAIAQAMAARHRTLVHAQSPWTAQGTAMGQLFTLHAHLDEGLWEVVADRTAPQNQMSGSINQMMEGAVNMILSMDAIAGEGGFTLAGADSLNGVRVQVLRLEGPSPVGRMFSQVSGGTIGDLRLLVSERDQRVAGVRMAALVNDSAGSRTVQVQMAFGPYVDDPVVTMPRAFEFTLIGLVPPLTPERRQAALAQVAAALEQARTLGPAERQDAERRLHMAEGMIRDNRMVVNARLERVSLDAHP
jgi:hypothetical protein